MPFTLHDANDKLVVVLPWLKVRQHLALNINTLYLFHTESRTQAIKYG